MRKLILALGFALRLCAAQVDNDSVENIHIADYYTYQGSSKGYYCGDTAVKLTDGSHWKIYEGDAAIVESWESNHPVCIENRVVFCSNPRHQFYLHNTVLNENVRVMFVHHTLKITSIQRPHEWAYLDGERDIYLSDGSKWHTPFLSDDKFLDNLNPGICVYIVSDDRLIIDSMHNTHVIPASKADACKK